MRNPRSSESFRRRDPTLRLRARILLACEGNTEANYFQDLGLAWRINISPIRRACGLAPLKLVQEAYLAASKEKNFDAVFCVFDRDTHHCFHDAVAFASSRSTVSKKPFAAFTSTPCFEYWLLLHYGLTTTAFENCDAVGRRVRGHLQGYEKTMSGLYSSLLPRITDARAYAKRARTFVHDVGANSPMTNIDELLDTLEEFRQ